MELILEYRSEDSFADSILDIGKGPPSAFGNFGLLGDGTKLADDGIHGGDFPEAVAFVEIGFDVRGVEFPEGEFFFRLAVEGFLKQFPVDDVAAYGRVPKTGLKFFAGRAFLEIDVAEAVQYVEMHDGVQEFLWKRMAVFP